MQTISTVMTLHEGYLIPSIDTVDDEWSIVVVFRITLHSYS